MQSANASTSPLSVPEGQSFLLDGAVRAFSLRRCQDPTSWFGTVSTAASPEVPMLNNWDCLPAPFDTFV